MAASSTPSFPTIDHVNMGSVTMSSLAEFLCLILLTFPLFHAFINSFFYSLGPVNRRFVYTERVLRCVCNGGFTFEKIINKNGSVFYKSKTEGGSLEG